MQKNWRKNWRCRITLSQRILLPLVIILFILTGIRIFDLRRSMEIEKKRFMDGLRKTEARLGETANSLAKENLKLALAIATIPGVQESLVFEDRERLLGLIKPLLEKLRAASPYPLKIHFHQPPGKSFLRVWRPDKYGDDLRSFRKTVVEVLKTGKPIYGIEPGRAGLAVRGIAPIFWEGQDKPVGSVEVFTSLKAVAERLRRVAKEENALFWIETVKATVATEKDIQRVGRFRVLLPATSRHMALLDEKLLEEALRGSLFRERGDFLINAMPIKDYQGKSVGVYVRFVDLAPLKQKLNQMLYRSLLEVAVFLVLAVLIILWVLRANLVKPMKQALEAAERVARGELDRSVPYGGACELMELSSSLNQVIAAVGHYVLSVQRGVRNLEEISARMHEEAEKLSSGSDQVRSQTERVLGLTEAAAQEINQIATAVDQFTVAIQEIVNHVNQTSQGVERVKERVVFATEKIQSLAESSRRIGEVVKVIEDIAGQTNLLALNATIEAARAGEAGKGFAVVANEVKELAKQTTEATEDIRRMVEGIQKEVESTVAAIQEVDDIVSGVSDLATQMAGAAEEQSAVVNDIKTSIDRGTESVRTVVEEMKGTAGVLSEFLRIADGIKELQQSLSSLAEEMKKLSAQFRVREEVLRQIEKDLKDSG